MRPESPSSETPPVEAPRVDRRAWLRLSVLLAAAASGLGAVVALSRAEPSSQSRLDFDRKLFSRVQRRRATIVLIGNSMVGTRFDPKLLASLVKPQVALVLERGGSYSAAWYLLIKNFLLPSRTRPRRIVVFFRGAELTEPTVQVGGALRRRIEPLETAHEPELEEKLRPRSTVGRLGWWLRQLAPTQRLAPPAWADSSARLSSRLVSDPVEDDARMKAINAVFDMNELRSTQPAPPSHAPAEWRFEKALPDSLLPAMISLAAAMGAELAFVRVRRRVDADGEPEFPELTTYMAALAAYLRANDVRFVDTSKNQWERAEHYGEGDHIARRHRAMYTRSFVAAYPELFS